MKVTPYARALVVPLVAAALSLASFAVLTLGLGPVTLIAPWAAAIDAIESVSPEFMSDWVERFVIAAIISGSAAIFVAVRGQWKNWTLFWKIGGVLHIVALSALLMIWADGTFSFILSEVANTEPWRSLPPSPFQGLTPLLYLPRLAVLAPIVFWLVALARSRPSAGRQRDNRTWAK